VYQFKTIEGQDLESLATLGHVNLGSVFHESNTKITEFHYVLSLNFILLV